MPVPSPFSEANSWQPTALVDQRGVELPESFSPLADEYRAARDHAVMFDRSDRGLLVVTGADRKDWLHNFVTNDVKKLGEDSGCYAFAIDVRGRVQFDLNVLNLPAQLSLDVDAATAEAARTHLDRYLLSEDVQLSDKTARFARLGCSGPGAAEVAGILGIADFGEWPALATSSLAGGGVCFFRHEFAGAPGFELVVPRAEAGRWWDRIARIGVPAAGQRTLDVLRIEAGIPWLHRDIDETILPPETGQAARAISYEKGCYLGQEIIERMRSRGSLARRLVLLRAAGGARIAVPAVLHRTGADVGRITSLVEHPITGEWIGLGYLRTSADGTTGITAGHPPCAIRVEEP